jgi:hypothetical protein
MKKVIIGIVVIALFNSCASILNSTTQKVILKHEPSLSLKIDTSKFYSETRIRDIVYIPKNYVPTTYNFIRSDNPIPLIIDNLDTINLTPHKSIFSYYIANIYCTLGLGMLIDKNSDKRFEYQKYNYFIKQENGIINKRFKPYKNKQVKLVISLPYINFFKIQTDSGKVNKFGFMGISAGINYFLKHNNYLSLNIGTAIDFMAPFPAPVDYYGPVEFSSTSYLDLRFNKISPRIEYGLGINLSQMKWREDFYGPMDSTIVYTPSQYKSLNLGLSCSFQYRFSPLFNIGILYHPQFYDFYNKQYNYQHFISTEFIWRF